MTVLQETLHATSLLMDCGSSRSANSILLKAQTCHPRRIRKFASHQQVKPENFPKQLRFQESYVCVCPAFRVFPPRKPIRKQRRGLIE